MTLMPRVVQLLKEQNAQDILVFGGGIIPEEDVAERHQGSTWAALASPVVPFGSLVFDSASPRPDLVCLSVDSCSPAAQPDYPRFTPAQNAPSPRSRHRRRS
jgi:hypothetical protein